MGTQVNGKQLTLVYYKYKPGGLTNDIEQSDLIISHGGAGTILETLYMHKRLLVVVNDELMDNHQLELAEKFSQLNNLVYVSSPNKIYQALAYENVNKITSLTKIEQPKTNLFAEHVDKVMADCLDNIM